MSAITTAMRDIANGPRIIRLLEGGGPSTLEIEPLRFVRVVWSKKYSQARVRA